MPSTHQGDERVRRRCDVVVEVGALGLIHHDKQQRHDQVHAVHL